ncbi:helix-turn-helix transcriptional regulator [Paenibacillus hexagrammi]|uniref:YafY family transcriptional regulator n=1 Tax=Paenibacillus hexagrammi TaxID=2908839 RepID=A0ABY3SK84_9BACL|nr:YafY family protein [Paenibacillus sp. YPD9-1]UJF33511.1 YafY family transcriptional regulator [Paenibacillus sp. YPD9-1]
MLLLNRKRVSAKELSDRFEVSLRTIYRDIETINQAGIPVVSYPGLTGGYEIMDEYRIDRQFLSMEELQSIIIGLKGIRSTVGEQEVGTLLDKVGAMVAKSEQKTGTSLHNQIVIDMNPWRRNQADQEKLSLLREAIRQTKLIRFQYTSSQSELSLRTVEPMGIVVKGFGWYLYAYCLLREDFRVFRLSRMKELEVLSTVFTPRSDMVDGFSFHMSRHRQESSLVKLVLQIQPSFRAQAEDYFQPEHIAVQPDGTLIVTARQPDEPWLYGMLLSYGPGLRILEPTHIAAIIQERARQVVDLYR